MNIYKMEKRNTRQMEVAYIIYMMVGSMFNKVHCANEMTVDQLHLYYKEMGDFAQERGESRVLDAMAKKLGKYEGQFSQMNSSVSIAHEGDYIAISFYTGFENLIIYVAKNGEFAIIIK